MSEKDSALRDLLRTLSPPGPQVLRRSLDARPGSTRSRSRTLAPIPGRERPAWADLVDKLSFDPELRRRCVRLLGELEA
jgi:hypothetical protein